MTANTNARLTLLSTALVLGFSVLTGASARSAHATLKFRDNCQVYALYRDARPDSAQVYRHAESVGSFEECARLSAKIYQQVKTQEGQLIFKFRFRDSGVTVDSVLDQDARPESTCRIAIKQEKKEYIVSQKKWRKTTEWLDRSIDTQDIGQCYQASKKSWEDAWARNPEKLRFALNVDGLSLVSRMRDRKFLLDLLF